MSREQERGKSGPAGPVGVVADAVDGLREVVCLLAGESVSVSRVLPVGAPPAGQPEDASAFERALQSLQSDAATEIIVCIAAAPSARAVDRLLEQIRQSDKPTVACLLGSDPRLVWRAGAIPATRLDEAAMRATAWVRGWDQALISSQLEEQHDQLAALATDLRRRIGPDRRRIRGLFAGDALRREAHLMLARTLGAEAASAGFEVLREDADPLADLAAAWADTQCAAVVLSLEPGSAAAGVAQHEAGGPGPLLIAHVCGNAVDSARTAEVEAAMQAAGAVSAPSNAASALLAGLLVQMPAGGK